MHRVEKSVLVPYSDSQMFDLVANVKDYPQFLSWCAGSHERRRDDGSVEATLDIRYRGVRSRFTTHNRQVRPARIHIELLDGPFRRLHGEWTFQAVRGDACKVHLVLHFQFASGLLGRLIAPVFEPIALSLIDSFTRRAEVLYERRG